MTMMMITWMKARCGTDWFQHSTTGGSIVPFTAHHHHHHQTHNHYDDDDELLRRDELSLNPAILANSQVLNSKYASVLPDGEVLNVHCCC